MSGHDVEHRLRREHVAEPAEAGHHFVGHVEHAVFAAHLPGAALIARRRHDHAAGGQQRLRHEAGDGLRTQLEDLVLEIGDALVAELLDAHARRPAVRIGRGQMMHDVGGEAHVGLVARLAGDGGGQVRAAVIGVGARDDVAPGLLAQEVEIEMDEADRRIDRGRAAGGEEHAVEVARRVFRDAVREFDRRLGRVLGEGRVVAHALGLRRHRVGDLVAAIADIDAPHAAHAVDHALAFDVIDMHALGAVDDQRLLRADGAEVGPGMDEMPAVEILQPLDPHVVVEVGEHGRSRY